MEDNKKYCIIVPKLAMSGHDYFYSGFSGKVETVPTRDRACVFLILAEAREACDDINRMLGRPVGTTNHPSCYIGEWY